MCRLDAGSQGGDCTELWTVAQPVHPLAINFENKNPTLCEGRGWVGSAGLPLSNM